MKSGELDEQLGRGLIAMVGFRNLAVHNYQEIDMAILHGILAERLDDLRTFARQLLQQALA